MGIENNFITNTSEKLNIELTPEEEFYVFDESIEEKCKINSDTHCELSKFRINIELNWNSNKHLFAPSENTERFDDFQANFEKNKKHEQINVWHMTEWTSWVNDVISSFAQETRTTEKENIFQERLLWGISSKEYYSFDNWLYGIRTFWDELVIEMNRDKSDLLLFDIVWKDYLLSKIESSNSTELSELYGNILEWNFDYIHDVEGRRNYIIMRDWRRISMSNSISTKEEIIDSYKRKLAWVINARPYSRIVLNLSEIIELFSLEWTIEEVWEKIINWEYPEVSSYLEDRFSRDGLSSIYVEDYQVDISAISKEYLLSNVIEKALQNQANQKIIQGLWLTNKEAYEVYYARLDQWASTTSMTEQQSFLESQKDKLSYNQKILLTAINWDLLGSFYDYDRLNNLDNSGEIDFDYLTNEIAKIHQINELSVTILQSDISTLADLSFNTSFYWSAEQIWKILDDRWYFQQLSDILWVDIELIKKEFVQIDHYDEMSLNMVIQKFSKLISKKYIDTNAVCKDVWVYGAWESHVLWIKDSFATSNNRWGWSHVVDWARAENGNIYFKNYWDLYQTNETTLDKAMDEYEKSVLHWVVLQNFYSEWKDKWSNIHWYQTKSWKIIERVIKDWWNSLDNSLWFLDGSYNSENKWFELNATEDESTYSYSFDSGLWVKLYSWMTDATLGSYKWGAIRYDFIENGNVFKSSITHISADLIGWGKQKGLFWNIVLWKVLEHEFEDKSIFKSYIKWDLIIWKSENEWERGYGKSFDYKWDLEVWMSYQKDGFEIAWFTWVHWNWDNLTNISEFKDIAEHATVSKPYVWGYLWYSNENIEWKIWYKKDDFYGTKTKFAEINWNITEDLSISARYNDIKWNGFSSWNYRNFSVLADYSVNKNFSVWVWLKHDEEFSNIWNNWKKRDNIANVNMNLRF